MTAHGGGPHGDLLAEFERAKRRCEVNDQLCRWMLDLTARIKTAQSDFMNHDCSSDSCGVKLRALEREWSRFKLARALAKERQP
jgi:hypothetical protein